MKTLRKFIPITKIEEVNDGTLIVHGIFTAQRPDHDNEVCDYTKSKPFYQALAKETAGATEKVEGMAVSLFPLRYMHQLDAVGAGRALEFDDDGKVIRGSAHVVDTEACKKVRTGVLRAFSQGGAYIGELVDDPEFKGCKRYVCDPGEISLVDRPCLPEAVIESISNKSLTFTKADGSSRVLKALSSVDDNPEQLTLESIRAVVKEELTKKDTKTKRVAGEDLPASSFAYVGDPDDTSTWKLPIKFSTDDKSQAHLRNALARFDQVQGIPAEERPKVKRKLTSAAKEHGIQVGDEAEKLQRMLAVMKSAETVQKGMYTLSQLAEVTEALSWIRQSVAWEREMEGDASTLPESMTTLLEDAVACLQEMCAEESEELLAAASGHTKVAKGATTMDPKELQKALEKAKDHLKALHGHLQKLQAHSEKMAAHHESMHKAAGDLEPMYGEAIDLVGSELANEKAAGGSKAKSHIEKMQKAHGKLMDMHKVHADMHKAHADHMGKAMAACDAAMDGKDPDKAVPEPEVAKLAPEVLEVLNAVKTLTATVADLKTQVEVQKAAAAAAAAVPAPVVQPEPAATPAGGDDLKKALEAITALTGQVEELRKGIDPNNPANKVKGTLVPRPGEGMSTADAGGAPGVGF